MQNKILLPKLRRLRKRHSMQYALLNLFKVWQRCLYKPSVVVTVIMDFSKAYYYLPHNLLLAKPSTYGFDESPIALIANYLSN